MNKALESGSFLPSGPFHMVWLATDMCNARCLHCSSNSTTQSPDELSTKEACALMDQFVSAGVVDLAISGGEPLLRKDIIEIIAYAIRRGLSVGIGSNGAYLSQSKANQLAKCRISRFQVSLDGDSLAHDRLRRWPGLFDRAIRTIQKARQTGLRVHVCCTINRLNWNDLESFTAFIASQGVSRLNFSRYVPTGRGSHNLDMPLGNWREVIVLCEELKRSYQGKLEIVSHLAQQILIDSKVAKMPGFIGCQAGIGQGAVTANGTVLPCVLLPLSVGNIRQEDFSNIWKNSPILEKLRHRNLLEGRCSTCKVRERCGGCRAVSYAKTGSYLADDPRCWLPHAQIEAVQVQ